MWDAGLSVTFCRRRCLTVKGVWLKPRLTARNLSETARFMRL